MASISRVNLLAPQTIPAQARVPESEAAIPWYLWCSVLALTSNTIGGYWDLSWHRSIGRDSFLTPAHIAIYLCGVLSAISCGYLILNTTFRRPASMLASSVKIFGFDAPLGAFISAWGGIAMLTSAPFDDWWHNTYGLDVKVVSPPHALLQLGSFAVAFGTFILILGALNRAIANGRVADSKSLQRLLMYVGGLIIVFQMFFRYEWIGDTHQHSSIAYASIAIGIPTIFAMLWYGLRNRWSLAMASGVYMVFLIGQILILPLFPAVPKLGPVYYPVTHFVPAPFPILLLVPAALLELFWNRTQAWKPWQTALASGPVFVLSLVAAQWPFANFLMSKYAANRFFATTMFSYGTKSTGDNFLRHFTTPEYGMILTKGLVLAAVYAAVSTWIGIHLGRWMRSIER
ncbi:MAG TPA: hypothetical protein VK604_17805 [Bryobacteraceae bacterium]|nr:hypothetical protein [Bryobacteraceae bacterium]